MQIITVESTESDMLLLNAQIPLHKSPLLSPLSCVCLDGQERVTTSPVPD